GTPKGVVVPRGALANLLFSTRGQPGLTASDRLLAITTFNFDISLLELLLPMAAGARLVIASREQALDGERLGALVRRHGITVLQGTPSTWYQLLESGWQGETGLRALVGGERLSRELAERLRPRVSELWNMYGPTETTIWSACSRVEPQDGLAITVGRPLAGTRMVVADAWGREAGIGVQGEILIAGAGVALGYLGKEAMTAERFQVFTRISPREIFYRTGDIGRWTEGGQLECLGRTDAQVKVRGYRIEPGEIESVAANVEGVSRAIVTTSASSDQDVRLLLHVQVAGKTADVVAALREELRKRLPEYMIPGAIIPVDAIPLLPNGKTDFARLPAATGIGGLSAGGEAPLSDHELALHGIWCSLLQRKAVGRHENFFELGGHSLLAMRMVTRIREDLLLHCTLSQVFRSPTIARLGAALQQTSPHTDQSLVPLQLDGSSPPLFCICGVQLYRPLALHLADKGPLFAAYVPIVVDGGAGAPQRDSIVALGAQYMAMLREQQPAGPYRLMGFSLGGVIAYEIAQRLIDAGETVSELIILDSDAPGMGFTDRLRSLRSLLPPSGNKPAARDDDRYLQSIRNYRAKRYTGRVVLVEATDTVHPSRSSRWRRLIPDLVHLTLHSDHLAMMSEPRVTELATLLRPNLP
ncbi:MAG: Linear gramicidin synthase subunit, partial [Pseudomonadota bacterium]